MRKEGDFSSETKNQHDHTQCSQSHCGVEFYEEGLGFPRMESPPEVAFFTLNGTWLGLYVREALAEDAAYTLKDVDSKHVRSPTT